MPKQLGRGEFRPALSPVAEENAEWDRYMWAEMGREIQKYLAAKVPDKRRTVVSLQQFELEGIAWAAVCSYLAIREARLQELKARGMEADDGLNYLLG